MRASHIQRVRSLLGLSLALAAIVGFAPAAPIRVLFVGNSLTTVNDLPAMVARLAASANRPFSYKTVAFDGYSLEDHWQRGDARRAIAEGGWSFVVLQQGPSARPESRVNLREYVRKFDAEARRAGARIAMYMVWPPADRRGEFLDVRQSYALAAQDVGGLLLPAGDGWREGWRRDPDLALYGPDGFHPTPFATYLAALVMAQAFFHEIPAGAAPPGTSAAQAALAREAAAVVTKSTQTPH